LSGEKRLRILALYGRCYIAQSQNNMRAPVRATSSAIVPRLAEIVSLLCNVAWMSVPTGNIISIMIVDQI
jgi:hypothetical protein